MAYTVLLVDDELAVLQTLVRRFRKESFRLRTATSAEEALRILSESPIDLIVSDFHMPGMSGGELLARVATQYPDCIRIMLTGQPSLEVAIGAINNGEVYRFLTKPYDAEMLGRIIRDALDQRVESAADVPSDRGAPDDVHTSHGPGAPRPDDGEVPQSVLDWALESIITMDHEGKAVELNPAAERMFQLARATVIGKHVEEVFAPSCLRDFLSASCAALTQANQPPDILGRRMETTFIRPDGSEVPIELVTILVPNSGRPFLTSFIRDLTEIRSARASLKTTEERLRQAQKLEALGRLAGGICHDFNNLLTVINGYSDLLLLQPEIPTVLREPLEQIKGAGERAAALTGQLLLFSRKKALAPTLMDINTTIRDFSNLLRRIVGEKIELVISVPTDPLYVFADQGQLEQVLMNLVVNANDAMPGGGQVFVGAKAVDEPIQIEPKKSHGVEHWVQLTVCDSGTGMDEETQRHVFEPFFTTKGTGKGTGLGLATVAEIVTQLGGRIDLQSRLGQGTTFKIDFPRIDEASAPQALATDELGFARGNETVLVVEDSDDVRGLARAVLEGAGYKVLEARNGTDALLYWQQLSPTVDLVLTDVVMPHMDGVELADALANKCPELPVVCMSGYTDQVESIRRLQERGVMCLQKPFTPVSLSSAVRLALDG